MSKPRYSIDEWRRIFRQQQASGQSVAAFCQRTGVPISSFYLWRRRVESGKPSVPALFTEARIMSPSSATGRAGPVLSANEGGRASDAGADAGSAIELVVADHFRVTVRRGFDRRTLADLLDVLHACAVREAGT
jgi:hypothetical protein